MKQIDNGTIPSSGKLGTREKPPGKRAHNLTSSTSISKIGRTPYIKYNTNYHQANYASTYSALIYRLSNSNFWQTRNISTCLNKISWTFYYCSESTLNRGVFNSSNNGIGCNQFIIEKYIIASVWLGLNTRQNTRNLYNIYKLKKM